MFACRLFLVLQSLSLSDALVGLSIFASFGQEQHARLSPTRVAKKDEKCGATRTVYQAVLDIGVCLTCAYEQTMA